MVGLACYYIKCHCFILLISIFSLLFCVLVTQDSLDAQVSLSCTSDPGYLVQFSFMSKLSSHFRVLSRFLAHRTPCCPVNHTLMGGWGWYICPWLAIFNSLLSKGAAGLKRLFITHCKTFLIATHCTKNSGQGNFPPHWWELRGHLEPHTDLSKCSYLELWSIALPCVSTLCLLSSCSQKGLGGVLGSVRFVMYLVGAHLATSC